jgi:hypothetical protein
VLFASCALAVGPGVADLPRACWRRSRDANARHPSIHPSVVNIVHTPMVKCTSHCGCTDTEVGAWCRCVATVQSPMLCSIGEVPVALLATRFRFVYTCETSRQDR